MFKRGIEVPKIWMKGQIWCWTDPVYGSHASNDRRIIPEGEISLRYSRMVLIFCNDETITQKQGNVIAIPLSSHLQYANDVQLNLSDVLRNDQSTWVCVSCMHLIRTQDLTRYVCTVSDSQLALINDSVQRMLFNTNDSTKTALIQPRAVTMKDERIRELVKQFIHNCVFPTNSRTATCRGMNVWSAWLKFLQHERQHKTIINIQDFGRLFIELRGNQLEEVQDARTIPFVQMPFRVKLLEFSKPAKHQPALEPEEDTVVVNQYQVVPEEDTPEPPKAPKEEPQVMTIDNNGVTLQINAEDHWKIEFNRRNRHGYYVIRDTRVIGVINHVTAQPGDHIFCFTKGNGPINFPNEEKIKEFCQYYATHSQDDTAKHFGIAGSTVTRMWNRCAAWAGFDLKRKRVPNPDAPKRGKADTSYGDENHKPDPKNIMAALGLGEEPNNEEKPKDADRKASKPAESEKEKITFPSSWVMVHLDDKITHVAHMIASMMEGHDMFNICQRYQMNPRVSISDSLFYRKIQTSTYFAIGEMLDLPRTGNRYTESRQVIYPTTEGYKCYQTIEMLNNHALFHYRNIETSSKMAMLRAKYGPTFGMSAAFVDIFKRKMESHMNLTEEGVETLAALVREHFCEKDAGALNWSI